MSVFHFKEFSIEQSNAALKVGTDSMLLGAFARFESPKNILDIGTGTGVLSLMVAQKYPKTSITALEIDESAALCARTNFDTNSLGKNISCIQTSLQNFETEQLFDGIISNPPYFEESLKNTNQQKARARHTDSLPYEDLILGIKRLLTANGLCWIICPFENAFKIKALISNNQLFLKERIQVESKKGSPVRTILCFGNINIQISESTFVIRDEDNRYSKEYVDLTEDFHNKSIK
jgi:tRNA1Val (adenine37-N6)-methyltransferase